MNKNNKTKTIENYSSWNNNQTVYISEHEAMLKCHEETPVKDARKCTNTAGDIRWQCHRHHNTPSSS